MTTPTGQAGHAGVPGAMARAGQRLTDRIAHAIGTQAAVAWVHAGALLHHATTTGHTPGLHPPTTLDEAHASLKILADTHPALADLTNPAVCPAWGQPIGDDDIKAITALWAQHPVTDPAGRPHGYLLGNAYQALSAEARKTRALCQTPRFVTDLLIDLAMRPAWSTWPIAQVRMIDPACGTGHILVETLLAAYQVAALGPHATTAGDHLRIDHDAAVATAVGTVHGLDLDPYAALIARYRLLTLTAALLDVPLSDVPHNLSPRVRAADALLGREEPLLGRGQYHAVVMNPPYITPPTAAVRDAVRAAYPLVCHGKYALSLPFHQVATDLLVPGGWCAQLTANSFMKREFGRRFVEEYVASQDLRAVLDTSGAYIPGHGTPTVILVHRNQPPVGDTVFTVLGKRGEPSLPDDPSAGVVWADIAGAARAWLLREWTGPREIAPPSAVVAAASPIREQLALFTGGEP